MALPCFRNRRAFGNFNVSSENFRTFAVGKEKGFEKNPSENLEFGLHYSTGAATPLTGGAQIEAYTFFL